MTRECGAEGGGGGESACSVLPQRRCGCLDLNFVRLGFYTSARHARMAHVSMTNRARHQIERYLTLTVASDMYRHRPKGPPRGRETACADMHGMQEGATEVADTW